jgi:hypothetical protein
MTLRGPHKRAPDCMRSEASAERLPGKREGWFSPEIWIAVAVYCAIVIPYFRYVPIWDAFDYLEAYLFLPRDHLSWEGFLYTENGHPSFGYYWPFWIGQTLFPDQLLVVQILNLLIGCLAVIAFGRLAAHLFRGAAGRLEIGLLTMAFAVSPVFVAYAVNMTMDSGVVAYFLVTLWLLYAGRFGWAAVAALLLIFCKEAGILFYTLIVLAFVPRALDRYRWTQLWPVALPFAGFILFLLGRWFVGKPYSPWAKGNLGITTDPPNYVPNPFSHEVRMALAGPFVLQFDWILTVFIIAGMGAALFALRSTGESGVRGWLRKFSSPIWVMIFLLVGILYVVTRTVPFLNQRYFLPLYPLVLLCFFAALIQLRIPLLLRAGGIALVVILFFGSNFRTLDPVSRQLCGTFPFGTHAILDIEELHRPGSTNKDAMVYNLEHTEMCVLLDQAFAAIKPTSQTVLVRDLDSWRLWERLDARTFHRTVSHLPPVLPVTHFTPQDILAMKSRPEDLYLVELPYFHNATNEALLLPFYTVKRRLTFTDHGYAISVLEMTRKPALGAANLSTLHDRLFAHR